jgi:hypothetical protein
MATMKKMMNSFSSTKPEKHKSDEKTKKKKHI